MKHDYISDQTANPEVQPMRAYVAPADRGNSGAMPQMQIKVLERAAGPETPQGPASGAACVSSGETARRCFPISRYSTRRRRR